MKIIEEIPIIFEAKEVNVVKELTGKKVPAAFLLNSGDYGYGRFEYDEMSQKAFEENLSVSFI
jgi:hypothetical protein